MDKLSKERPLSSIFNAYVVLSILIQFAIHVAAFLYLTDLCEKFDPCVPFARFLLRSKLTYPLLFSQADRVVDLEAKFSPNLLNSCIYLISLSYVIFSALPLHTTTGSPYLPVQATSFDLCDQLPGSPFVVLRARIQTDERSRSLGTSFPRGNHGELGALLRLAGSRRCRLLWSDRLHPRVQPLAPARRDGQGSAFLSLLDDSGLADLVPQFRVQLCLIMVVDYGGAWIAEIVMKYFFADNKPKPLITRGLERREARRAEEARLKEIADEAIEEAKFVALAAKKDL